jgi:hypothetical protein
VPAAAPGAATIVGAGCSSFGGATTATVPAFDGALTEAAGPGGAGSTGVPDESAGVDDALNVWISLDDDEADIKDRGVCVSAPPAGCVSVGVAAAAVASVAEASAGGAASAGAAGRSVVATLAASGTAPIVSSTTATFANGSLAFFAAGFVDGCSTYLVVTTGTRAPRVRSRGRLP